MICTHGGPPILISPIPPQHHTTHPPKRRPFSHRLFSPPPRIFEPPTTLSRLLLVFTFIPFPFPSSQYRGPQVPVTTTPAPPYHSFAEELFPPLRRPTRSTPPSLTRYLDIFARIGPRPSPFFLVMSGFGFRFLSLRTEH